MEISSIYKPIFDLTEIPGNSATNLIDQTNIITDSSSGNLFYVTLTGNRTMNIPLNPYANKKIIYAVKQDATGNRTISWNTAVSGFRFANSTPPTLSASGNKTDYIGFCFNNKDHYWDCLAERIGF